MTDPATPSEAKRQLHAEAGASWVTLFASAGTLVCCALPIALVTLGLGAALSSLTSSFPVLITLSQYNQLVAGVTVSVTGTSLLDKRSVFITY